MDQDQDRKLLNFDQADDYNAKKLMVIHDTRMIQPPL